MRELCTLFDRNYLYKGLALYNSLLQCCPQFRIWILCMDEICYNTLKSMGLVHAELIKLADFEDIELLQAKPTRSVAEYCWTCTPSLPLYVLKQHPYIEMITYLDADLFFFSDPAPIFDEFDDSSIMIIEHRFPDYLKHLEVNGIYNVQMMVFRNDVYGLECLEWWRARCNEWCFYRLEDGKLGDQKYLDDWTTRFKGVHVLQHIGSGVALWNVMQYDVHEHEGTVYTDNVPLVFYHFHGFKLLDNGKFNYGEKKDYPLAKIKKRLIYKPYIKALQNAILKVNSICPGYNHGFDESLFTKLKKRLTFSKKKSREMTGNLPC